MKRVKEHYDQQLASVYSWMVGTSEDVIERNVSFFRQAGFKSMDQGLAIDLGSGPGFQSIPLAKLGFSVVAIDFCEALLLELNARASDLSIRTIQDDILNFSAHIEEPAQVVVCMGDTLTHLASQNAVRSLILSIERALAKGGQLVLTFRDYVLSEAYGAKRFIPVRSDESMIFTCFLEYHEDFVEVYDLLYKKEGTQWTLHTSSYPKLRIDRYWLCGQLQALGLCLVKHEIVSGMVCIVAQKV